jgi:4-carboxymuconolactone decarboxylase
MSRLPLLDRDDLAEGDRAVYDRLQASRGVPTGNIWRALANAPNLLDRILSLADELRHGVAIDRQYREAAVLMVGLVSGSQYEFDHHWNAAVKAGIPKAKLESLTDFETSALFSDAERAVLRYAREASLGEVTDTTWQSLRNHFDERQALEIVVTVAWYACVVRILVPLKIENEPWFKRL